MVVLLGAAAMIEMVYHLQLNTAMGNELVFLGITLNAKGLNSWVGSAFVMLCGVGLFEIVWRQFKHDWDGVQMDIEREIKRREALAA
jgi:branched-chain amino acid transport system permease protein